MRLTMSILCKATTPTNSRSGLPTTQSVLCARCVCVRCYGADTTRSNIERVASWRLFCNEKKKKEISFQSNIKFNLYKIRNGWCEWLFLRVCFCCEPTGSDRRTHSFVIKGKHRNPPLKISNHVCCSILEVILNVCSLDDSFGQQSNQTLRLHSIGFLSFVWKCEKSDSVNCHMAWKLRSIIST